MKKKQVIKAIKLIEQWTRAEIMARHGFARNFEFGDYAMIAIEKENEIREVLYGESDLVALGEQWGILKPRLSDVKRKKKIKMLLKKQDTKNNV